MTHKPDPATPLEEPVAPFDELVSSGVVGASAAPTTAACPARTASSSGPCAGLTRAYPVPVHLEFSGEMWFWKGPAPWHFVTVPDDECGELEATSSFVSYGWGMIPVSAQIGETEWTTSLYPKDGRYVVPVKAWVRKAEGLEVGDLVTVRLAVDV